MIPMSNSSLENRRRKAHSPRRTLVRSNSSLLGSIKNFVAAPFTRLFTAPGDDFDDPNDYTGKRRRILNQNIDNNVIQEDGPAPAKRMRIRSPESPPSAYLDPPTSAFKSNNLYNNPPNRSSSSLPPPTVQDPVTVNTRSTISPLRRQLSQTMIIDPSNNRSLSRDISMQSIPLYNTDSRNAQSATSLRDQSSMPPLTGRPFRMRTSLTPQPTQQLREASEPPALSTLHSKPVFVRAPSQSASQPPEPRSKPVTTLGSLVDSQRSSRPPVRQHSSLLFGTPAPTANPEAANAEKVLRELDFYKTPLVPTRIRSKMSNQLAAQSSASSITDMFNRKNTLVLMGDHDRPSKKDRKKAKTKEANSTKPYAGTGGIKKRLAKAKGTPEPEAKDIIDADRMEEARADASSTATSEPASIPVPEIPPPLPREKDVFSVAAPATNGVQTSSLRVGRAPRSHLSRPSRPAKSTSKFSAAYEEDEDISEESRKDLEMLEEAAKNVPVFKVPDSFKFPEAKPVEQDSNAKEPPITSLPFSLAKPPVLSTAAAPIASAVKPLSFAPPATSTSPAPDAPSVPAASSLSEAPSQLSTTSIFAAPPAQTSSFAGTTETASLAKKVPNFFANPAAPLTPPAESTGSSGPVASANKVPDLFSRVSSPLVPPTTSAPSTTDTTETPGKVPNFFGGSKFLSVPSPSTSPLPAPSAPAPEPAPASSSPFSFGTTEAAPVQNEGKKDDVTPKPFTFGGLKTDSTTGNSSSLFGFDKPATPEPEKKNDAPSFLFGQSQPSSQPTPSVPTSFGKPEEPSQPSPSLTSAPFSFGGASSSNVSTETSNKSPFTFGAGSTSIGSGPAGSLFSSNSATPKPENSISPPAPFSFGQPPASNNNTTTSLFGAQSGAESSKPSTGFTFDQSQKDEQPKASPFGSTNGTSQSAGFSFNGSSTNTQPSSSGFSFSSGTNSNNDTSKSFSFGAAPPRPATPPNQEEVRMDESPVRDPNPKPSEPRPSLGFSFGSSSSLFGQSSSTPTPAASVSTGFGFGTNGSGGSNGFGGMKTDDKPEVKSTSLFGGGGFGQQSSAGSPFSFGAAKAPEAESSRPATAGGFGSGSTSSSFAFGAGPSNSSPFGQPSTGSAPASPSTFSQTPSFGFGSGNPSSTSNPFAFGSSPAASPATPNTALPPSGFGGSSSGFGATPSTPTFGGGGTPSGGSNLFTIGAAPDPSPGGARPIKRLPRRGGKR